MPRPFIIFLLTTLFIGPLAGCGQKGPLYLPDESPPAGTADSRPAGPHTEQ
jgi:predicted small lipoprotein YifL